MFYFKVKILILNIRVEIWIKKANKDIILSIKTVSSFWYWASKGIHTPKATEKL